MNSFLDGRPLSRSSHDLQAAIRQSPRLAAGRVIQEMADRHSRSKEVKTDPVQEQTEEVLQACRNPAFLEAILFKGEVERELEEESSLDLAATSREQGRGLAFIVNAILPYSEVGRIPEVIRAMLNGLEDESDAGRVAIVLGINAREEEEEELDRAMARATELIAELPVPVALVRSTFTGKFPYGRMRNDVLHSTDTRLITEYFLHLHLHPYISIQDFDTGSRRVGSEEGQHVFHAIDELLLQEEDSGSDDLMRPTEAMAVSPEQRIAALPLMIGGGYRVGDKERLATETLKRLAKPEKGEKGKQKKRRKIRERLKGMEPKRLGEELGDFPEAIHRDMRHRDRFARMSPLLPYGPEPNLFLDASAVYAGSPLSRTPLAFGDAGAEYTELAKRMGRFSAEELESFYTDQYRRRRAMEEDGGARELLEEIRTSLLIDAQNNRHPIRGKGVHMDFERLAIETDLSRIAEGYLMSGRKEFPQSHIGLKEVTDRLYASKKAKKGASLAGVRDPFSKGLKKKGLRRTVSDEMEEVRRPAGRGKSTKKKSASKRARPPVVKGMGKDLSEAISVPFDREGLFSGLHYGMDPAMKKYLLFQVATQQTREQYIEDELALAEANRENFLANFYPLLGGACEFRVSDWTVADGDCGIYSLGIIGGERDITRQRLIEHLNGQAEECQRRGDAERAAEFQNASASISGFNSTRWLSDDDLIRIGNLLGLHSLAVVQFNSANQTWVTMQGDPATAAHVIGGVPVALDGEVNHWVVLERRPLQAAIPLAEDTVRSTI